MFNVTPFKVKLTNTQIHANSSQYSKFLTIPCKMQTMNQSINQQAIWVIFGISNVNPCKFFHIIVFSFEQNKNSNGNHA